MSAQSKLSTKVCWILSILKETRSSMSPRWVLKYALSFPCLPRTGELAGMRPQTTDPSSLWKGNWDSLSRYPQFLPHSYLRKALRALWTQNKIFEKRAMFKKMEWFLGKDERPWPGKDETLSSSLWRLGVRRMSAGCVPISIAANTKQNGLTDKIWLAISTNFLTGREMRQLTKYKIPSPGKIYDEQR